MTEPPSTSRDFGAGVRVAYLFHEAARLGAGVAVLRVLDDLRRWGWSPAAWFPESGPLLEEARGVFPRVAWAPSPLAVSARGWREAPGVAARVRATPAYLRAVRAALRELRPHVVHANTLLTLPEATAARSLGLPVVLHVHELPPDGAKTRATLRWAATAADVLVGVSTVVTEMLSARAGRTPVVTVHNGVPADGWLPRGPRDRFVVGSIGSVSRRKGTDLLQEAASRLAASGSDIGFEVAGPLDAEPDARFVRSLVERAAAAPLTGRFSFLGPADVRSVLPGWDVFVLPSRQDPFPLASLEAMAAGVPVIAADVGGMREQIDHLRTGVLVPSDDAEALAHWIEKLRLTPELRERLSAAARARVRSAFSLEAQARGLNDAYIAAMNLRFAPPAVRHETRRRRVCA